MQTLFELHNTVRSQWGRNSLKYSQDLEKLAMDHANWLAKTWMPFSWAAHWGFSGRAKKITTFGFQGFVAENVSMGQFREDITMQSWMNSTAHRNNILGDYTHIGIGLAYKGVTPYWVVIFAK